MGHNNKLNSNQEHLLLLIYKFRYITAHLVAQHRMVLKWSVSNTLAILLDKKLVGRRYDKSYRLQGKGASYFLASEGLKLLKANQKLNADNLRVRYKDNSLSDSFIEHHLSVFKAYIRFKVDYPDRFQIFTKYELPDRNNYPENKADLYLKPKASNDKAYFLDIFEDVPFFVIKDRINDYISHYDEGNIDKEHYPTVLLVCPSPRIEQRVDNYLNSLLEDIDFKIIDIQGSDELLSL